MHVYWLLVISAIAGFAIPAAGQNSGLAYHGKLIGPDSAPVEGTGVQFRLQIRTSDSNECLLYEEQQTINMAGSGGVFAVNLNNGSGTRLDSSGYIFETIFANRGTFTFAAGTCKGTGSAANWTPAEGDGRKLDVYFRESAAIPTWEQLPTQNVAFVPMAIGARHVGGFTAKHLLRVDDPMGPAIPALTPANFTGLMALIGGTSSVYTKANELAGRAVATTAPSDGQVLTWNNANTRWEPGAGGGGGAPSGAAAGDLGGTYPNPSVVKIQGRDVYNVNPGNGQVLTWNNTSVRWEPQTISTAPSGAASGDLSGSYPGPTVARIQGRSIDSSAPADNQVMTWNNAASRWEARAIPAQSASGTAGGDLSGSYPNPSVSRLQGNAVLAGTPSDNHVLTWNNTASHWEARAIPTQSASGTAGGDLSGTYPNPSVAKLQGRDVASAAPADNQVLTWNNAATRWEPRIAASGADNLGNHQMTQNFQTKNFWLSNDGGDEGIYILANGRVGIGTTAPAEQFEINGAMVLGTTATNNDGAIRFTGTDFEGWIGTTWLSFTNPSGAASGDLAGTYPNPSVAKLQGRDIASSAPSDNQVLTWNNAASRWEARNIPTQTATGTAGGDLSGTYPNPSVNRIQGNAVLAGNPVNNQVLTWNTSATRWEARDIPTQTATGSAGGDLSGTYPNPSVNRIQGNAVLGGTPADNQVLTWNNAATRWEARAPATDNLGNHQMSQNLQTSNRWLSNDGGDEGIYILANGDVGVGTSSPSSRLDVSGGIRVDHYAESAPSSVNSGASYIIPNTTTNTRRIVLNSNTTITLPAYTSPAGTVYTLTVLVKQDATGNRTLAWGVPAGDSILWDASATAPSPSIDANKTTIYQFVKFADDLTWYASQVWQEN